MPSSAPNRSLLRIRPRRPPAATFMAPAPPRAPRRPRKQRAAASGPRRCSRCREAPRRDRCPRPLPASRRSRKTPASTPRRASWSSRAARAKRRSGSLQAGWGSPLPVARGARGEQLEVRGRRAGRRGRRARTPRPGRDLVQALPRTRRAWRRSSPSAPAEAGRRPEPRTEAPLEASSVEGRGGRAGNACRWPSPPRPPGSRFRRAVDRLDRRPDGRVGGELVLEALPPIGLGLCGPVRLPLCRLVRVEAREQRAARPPVPVVEPRAAPRRRRCHRLRRRASSGRTRPRAPRWAPRVEVRTANACPPAPSAARHARSPPGRADTRRGCPSRTAPAGRAPRRDRGRGRRRRPSRRSAPFSSGPRGRAPQPRGRRTPRGEGVEALRLERQAGGRPVPAEAGQVLGAVPPARRAGRSRECCDPTPDHRPRHRARSPRRRPVVPLDQSRSDDPDHPGRHPSPARTNAGASFSSSESPRRAASAALSTSRSVAGARCWPGSAPERFPSRAHRPA